jgi:hypothetical protein
MLKMVDGWGDWIYGGGWDVICDGGRFSEDRVWGILCWENHDCVLVKVQSSCRKREQRKPGHRKWHCRICYRLADNTLFNIESSIFLFIR